MNQYIQFVIPEKMIFECIRKLLNKNSNKISTAFIQKLRLILKIHQKSGEWKIFKIIELKHSHKAMNIQTFKLDNIFSTFKSFWSLYAA